MSEDTRLLALVRSARPPVVPVPPPADAWRRVVERNRRREWSWFDLAVAAAAVALLLLRPDWLVVLAYHL